MLRKSISVFAVRERRARPTLSRARLFITWTLFFLVVFSMVTLWWADRQLSRPLRQWAELQVRNIGQRAITSAVQDILANDGDLVRAEFVRMLPSASDGTAAWQYDWALLHRLETEITGRVLETLNALVIENIRVPLGELLGVDILAGAGPMVPVRIKPGGAVSSDVEFVFTAVGINQVLHEIAVRMEVQMRVIAPLVSDEFQVSQRIPLSTVILQGKVPQVFVEWKSGSMEDFIQTGLAAQLGEGQ